MEGSSWEFLGSKGLLKKHEYIRVLVQCLYALGYTKSASCLESESHISCKTADFESLESQVLNGNWDGCIGVLDRIMQHARDETRNTALYLVFKQCLFEYLKRGDDSSALAVVRKRVPQLRVGKEKIHKLACDILSLKEMESGEVDEVLVQDLRKRLLVELEKLIPSPVAIPERRLEHLVETTVMDQIDSCLYHNSSDVISLYEDHHCGRDQIPFETVQVLVTCLCNFSMVKHVEICICCNLNGKCEGRSIFNHYHIRFWMISLSNIFFKWIGNCMTENETNMLGLRLPQTPEF